MIPFLLGEGQDFFIANDTGFQQCYNTLFIHAPLANASCLQTNISLQMDWEDWEEQNNTIFFYLEE